MLKNLKFSSVNGIFFFLMLAICLVIVVSGLMVEKKSSEAESIWQILRTEHSAKMHLTNRLVAEMGYGGMVHAYKNYLLRNNQADRDLLISKMGAVRTILSQYHLLELNEFERGAVVEVENVLNAYAGVVSSTRPVQNETVLMTEKRALRSLEILVEAALSNRAHFHEVSRTSQMFALRQATGFGGMIHMFKDYVLTGKKEYREKTLQAIEATKQILVRYQKNALNQLEQIALDDVRSTVTIYQLKLDVVDRMRSQKKTAAQIDKAIEIEDQYALRGLETLEKQIQLEIELENQRMTDAVNTITTKTIVVMWVAIFSVLFISVLTYSLINHYVIKPIRILSKNIRSLSDGDYDISKDYLLDQNEIGDMARSVQVFRQTSIERKEAEEYLSKANDAITQQIHDIHQWRQRANEQTEQALELARGLSVAREAAEAATARAERDEKRIRLILETVRDALVTIDEDGTIETFNPGAEKMFGYFKHEVIGKNVAILMPGNLAKKHDGFIKGFVSGQADRLPNIAVEQPAQRKDGSIFPVEISLSTMNDRGHMKITALMRDVTERVKRDEEIKRLAMTDPLTGLANRNQYSIRLEDAARFAERNKKLFALMVIDLDKFKPINDTYGHPFGDLVLKSVANILKGVCREVDTVARIGGDEFSIILLDVENMEDVQKPIDRILDKISSHYSIEGESIRFELSIGVAVYGIDSNDINELIRFADKALYLAKESEDSIYQYYHDLDNK